MNQPEVGRGGERGARELGPPASCAADGRAFPMTGCAEPDRLPWPCLQRGCSIDEIKEAAKRAGDASKDWMSGSSEHAPRAMEVTVTITEELYIDTKRALEETLGVGKQRNEKALDHVQHTGDTARLQDAGLPQDAKASIASAAQTSNNRTMADANMAQHAADGNHSGIGS